MQHHTIPKEQSPTTSPRPYHNGEKYGGPEGQAMYPGLEERLNARQRRQRKDYQDDGKTYSRTMSARGMTDPSVGTTAAPQYTDVETVASVRATRQYMSA